MNFVMPLEKEYNREEYFNKVVNYEQRTSTEIKDRTYTLFGGHGQVISSGSISDGWAIQTRLNEYYRGG